MPSEQHRTVVDRQNHQHQHHHQKTRRREVFCLFLIVALLSVICFSSSTIFTDEEAAKRAQSTSQQDSDYYLAAYDASGGPTNTKTVLLWTAWYNDPEWKKVFAKNGGPWASFLDKDEATGLSSRRYCHLTTNRSLLNGADAVLFHSTDFHKHPDDLPPQPRLPWQKYIFFTLEPPQLNQLGDKYYRDIANSVQFNLTMSYSRYSDIIFPYGKVFDFSNKTRANPNFIANVNHRIRSFVHSFPKRPKDAVWIVSDCHTMGRREYIVEQLLKNGIKVDTWGKCFDKTPDPEWQAFGSRKFYEQYRFYFAFENALCEEYITEKAFQGMATSASYGVIPVVYGYSNYSQHLPEGSYIDATWFANVTELAKFLRHLSSPSYSPKKLTNFYGWQYKHYVPTDQNWRVVNGWRNLCRHLHSQNAPQPSLKSSLVESLPNLSPTAFSTENETDSSQAQPPLQSTNSSTTLDIRAKIGACFWTTDFFPDYDTANLQF